MQDSLEKISRVTGIKRQEILEIAEKVKANAAKLSACPRHEFTVPIDRHTKQPLAGRSTFCDWECSHCHGWVDFMAKQWYERGLAHALKHAVL